jgi:hypothetical protein
MKWGKKECSTYLQYKKRDGEKGKMPNKIEELRLKCVDVQGRSSPLPPSPHPSDDECSDGEESDVDANEAANGANEINYDLRVGDVLDVLEL